MKLRRITLTGMDDTVTDFPQVLLLAEMFPAAEWALLLGPGRQGRSRFPTEDWLEKFLTLPGLNLALHLCGEHATNYLKGETPALPVNLNQLLLDGKVKRLQINFTGDEDVRKGALIRLIDAFSAGGVHTIFQMKPKTTELVESLGDRISILFDKSGGRGIAPDAWPEFPVGKGYREVGYAGGLDPAQLERQLQEIQAVVGDHVINIDIESRLRDSNDRFSLDACFTALTTCLPYLEK